MRTPEPTAEPIAAAVREPIPEPVSAADNPAPLQSAMPDIRSAAQNSTAEGRLILSTAFVRVGPDGLLTVELHDGQTLLLRDVVMNAKDYCGARVSGSVSLGRYCGRYADVATARPGGGTASAVVDPAGSVRAPVGQN